MKTHKYLIYRIGSNSANQPMCHKAPVAIVRARNREDATSLGRPGNKLSAWTPRVLLAALADDPTQEPPPGLELLAAADDLEFWANQYAVAVPESKAPLQDWNSVLEQDAIRRSYTESG